MAQPRNVEQLRREKIGGVFVYFSSDETTFHKQKQNRLEHNEQEKLIKLPTDADAIILLVEQIKHPQLSIEQLSMRLSKSGHYIKPEVIIRLFEHHGILKKIPICSSKSTYNTH